jgi:hypothetical protein
MMIKHIDFMLYQPLNIKHYLNGPNVKPDYSVQLMVFVQRMIYPGLDDFSRDG